MPVNVLSVRELQKDDIEYIVQYWTESDSAFLIGMGVDLAKLPLSSDMREMLTQQLAVPLLEKQSYCIIWEVDQKPVGHCNINKISFGEEASMHLHLWDASTRKKGTGTALVKLALPYFFKKFKLKRLICEPNAFNPAPNKTLEKAGFSFSKTYVTIPGSITSEQQVNRWEMSFEDFQKLDKS